MIYSMTPAAPTRRDHARSIPRYDNLLPVGGSDGSARRHQDIRARRRKWELFGGCARAWDRAAGDQQAGRSARLVSQNCPRPLTFATRPGGISYQAAASFRSNDGGEQSAAVLAGLGITQAPYWLFAADISAGTVRRILRDREPARIAISAVRPAARRQPSKVAVVVAFLA